VHKREEVPRELLEAHGDAPEPLDALEETLDEVPLLVEIAVVLSPDRARGIRGDDDRTTVAFEELYERSRVLGSVGTDVGVRDVAEQLIRQLHLVRLPR
jgi:hypothetical protein